MTKIKISENSYFLLKTYFKEGFDMKTYTAQLEELELHLMQQVQQTIFDLLQLKFSNQLKEIVKFQISPIVNDIFNENNFWAKEIRNTLYNYVKEDANELAEQRAQLNVRMDMIEQRFIDLLRRFDDVIYSKK